MVKELLLLLKFLGLLGVFGGIYLLIREVTRFFSDLWSKVEKERELAQNEAMDFWLANKILNQRKSFTTQFVTLVSFCGFFLIGLVFTGFNPIIALLIGGAGILGVRFYFRVKMDQRYKGFNSGLAQALTLMSNALESGSNIYQAVQLVVEEGKPIVSEEFKKVLKEVELGIPLAESINNINQRIASADMRFVSSAILLAQESGGRLAEILNQVASLMKEREKFSLKLHAMTTQGRLSSIIVALIPIGVFLATYSMQKELIESFVSTPIGMLLIVLAIILSGVGILVVQKIVKIEV
ncbi:MAG TPA: type II secretion system F family protein [bacterium]|nr:type II secretion system F family protein [bacterium]